MMMMMLLCEYMRARYIILWKDLHITVMANIGLAPEWTGNSSCVCAPIESTPLTIPICCLGRINYLQLLHSRRLADNMSIMCERFSLTFPQKWPELLDRINNFPHRCLVDLFAQPVPVGFDCIQKYGFVHLVRFWLTQLPTHNLHAFMHFTKSSITCNFSSQSLHIFMPNTNGHNGAIQHRHKFLQND